MWPFLIIALLAGTLAALVLANRSDDREPATIPEPECITTVTAHVVTAHPAAVGTGPFAYDNGLAIDGLDDPDEEDP